MNRIEEIKERVSLDYYYDVTARVDIRYLLSIIEQAEKALTLFADDQNWMGRTLYDKFRTNGVIEWDGKGSPLLIAQEALQAIRGN